MGRQKTVTPEQRKQYHKEWRERNREKWNAYSHKWYVRNANKRQKAMRLWTENNPEKTKRIKDRYYSENKERVAHMQRVRLLGFKTQVVAAYGGCCKCCGEKEITFLTVEHCKRNGDTHRKVKGNFYHYLVRNNFPQEDLCILCMNCNWAERNGWPCPHKAKVASA